MQSGTERRMCRLIRLIQFLSGTDGASAPVLSDILDVSTRTVFRDIRLLRQIDLPLVYDEERQRYALRNSESITPRDLTVSDIMALVMLIKTADDALRDTFRLDDLWGKLSRHVPCHCREAVQNLWDRIELQRPSAPPHRPPVGRTLKLLITATAEEKKVRVRYRGRNGESQRTLLSPYAILEERQNWWIVGRSTVHRRVIAILVANIESTDLVDEPVSVPPRFKNRLTARELDDYAV